MTAARDIAIRRALGTAPALVLVTDASALRGRELASIVAAAVDGGVSIVQLRDKGASAAALIREGERLRAAIDGRALFFVNGDVEAALTLGADGVHLPDDGTSIAAVRARVGADMLISRAVHGIDAAVAAEHDGADIVQAGTMFESTSKPGAPILGFATLVELCRRARLPVIAIGGIDATNARSVLGAGAAGIAVISAIFNAADARGAAAELRHALCTAVAAEPNR